MKKLLSLILLINVLKTSAQQKQGWSIGVNPFSFVESQMSIGPCVSYRFSERTAIWAEVSYIFHNSYMPDGWKNMKGIRFILQPRYFIGHQRRSFLAPEFRIKHFSFNNTLDLTDESTHITLYGQPVKESQTLVGGAFVAGRQFYLSKNKNFMLELTAGIGAKQRYIKRKGIPAGYAYIVPRDGIGIRPQYEYNNAGTPYFPFSGRLIWKLK